MTEVPPQLLHALSAHIDGLRTALDALPGDPSLTTSVRRIARSVGKSAHVLRTGAMDGLSDAIESAHDPAEVERVARRLLERLEAAAAAAPTREVEILVVEDNATVAAATLAYLEAPGRTLHHATTAAEAENLLAWHPVDLVLLDLILPDRDGRDLLLQLREDPSTAGLPVIVLSATEGVVAKAECMAVGADEFLEKPVEPQTLRIAVARHLRQERTTNHGRLDAGTELVNRAGLTQAFGTLANDHDSHPLAVVLLSVGGYEQVTEKLGRRIGDHLMRTVAEALAAEIPPAGALGRWAPQDLLVLLPHTDTQSARELLKEGLASLDGAAVLDRCRTAGLQLSFSAGVALTGRGETLRTTVASAERSLYRAKRSDAGIALGAGAEPVERERTVLLVEDDRVTATLIHHRLVREGFVVMDFLNGEDAFRWAGDGAFDLAILDVKVPGMDGFELLERLRDIDRHRDVPIVMLTGLGSESDVIRGLELGANDYMLKPFSPTELLARIRRLMHSRSTDSNRRSPHAAEGGST